MLNWCFIFKSISRKSQRTTWCSLPKRLRLFFHFQATPFNVGESLFPPALFESNRARIWSSQASCRCGSIIFTVFISTNMKIQIELTISLGRYWCFNRHYSLHDSWWVDNNFPMTTVSKKLPWVLKSTPITLTSILTEAHCTSTVRPNNIFLVVVRTSLPKLRSIQSKN